MNTYIDLTQITATSSGSGSFVLGPNTTGFRGTENLTDGATYTYSVQQNSNWEIGNGTYIAATTTLTRVVLASSNSGQPVDFDVNATVSFTFGSADIAGLVALISEGSTAVTAKAAFNAYGLQWATWFNGTPGSSEMLAMYTAPVAFQYAANFAGAYSGAPNVNPAASFTMTMEQAAAGTSDWTEVGTITVGTDGGVALATLGTAVVNVGLGDRLRVLAPFTADTAILGFSVTFKGYIP